MTASLPAEVQSVFDRFITVEYTTIDRHGQPITWPVTPYYHPGDDCIDVTTGLGYPKKADDARTNPKVGMLFSDRTGSGLRDAPTVLVQGTANVDDGDLDANRERYVRDSSEKLPAASGGHPPDAVRRKLLWYYARIYVHVRPERVYVWPGGDTQAEPELLDAHMEEVRSGHDEEPEAAPQAEGGRDAWDDRIDVIGQRYRTGVLSVLAPDGFPFSVRVPIAVDRAARRVRIERAPVGAPLAPGRACLTAHDHAPDFTWQRNTQVRGDLIAEGDDWALVPHRVVGGFELPPGSIVSKLRPNVGKARRYHARAKRELERRMR